MRSTVFL